MIAVPLFRRFKLSAVLGYLAAGVVIGPWGLGLFSDVESILHFSEFGVVLLLFIVPMAVADMCEGVLAESSPSFPDRVAAAAPVGRRRPCSQFCTVRTLTFSSRANCFCDSLVRCRMCTRRVGENS